MSGDDQNPEMHAFTPQALRRVRAALEEAWDPDGALAHAAAAREAVDPAAPRSLDDLVVTLCGMLAAGATRADVVDYLRAEEGMLLGAVRTPPRVLGAVGRELWLAARGLPAD